MSFRATLTRGGDGIVVEAPPHYPGLRTSPWGKAFNTIPTSKSKAQRSQSVPRRNLERALRTSLQPAAAPGGAFDFRGVPRLSVPPTVYQKGLSPFGQRFMTRLPFYQLLGLTNSTLGIAVGNVFRLNAPYDPDETGVGTSARFYSQLTALYQRQRTLAATFTVRFTDPSADGTIVGYRIRRGTETTSIGMTLAQFAQLPFAATLPLNNTGSQLAQFQLEVPIHIPWNLTAQAISSDIDVNFSSLTAANPSNIVNLDVVSFDTNGVASTVKVTIAVEYHTLFYILNQV